MHEVYVESVDLSAELGQCVDESLLLSPIKLSEPVLYEFFEIRKLGAVVPPGPVNLIRPSRAHEALPEIDQDLRGHV
jgi:hypothetical protein